MRSDIEAAMKTWRREYETTMSVFERIPEGKNTITAVPDRGWELGGLMWHICISERWFCTDIMGAKPEGENTVPFDPAPSTIAEMSAAFKASHSALLETVESKGEAWMDETIQFYGNPWTRLELLQLMFRHEAHHRGQLSVLMLVAGATPPTIYGAPGVNIEDAG